MLVKKTQEKTLKNQKIYPWEKMGIREEKDFFLENLSMLVGSGLGISQSLFSIQNETRSRSMKKIISLVKEAIDDGAPLWRALERVGLFSGANISLIRLGESSGKLSQNLKTIVIQEQKERLFFSKVRSAMLYPMLVFSLTATVGLGVAWFILPKLSLVFSQLNIDLPWITRALIWLGKFLGQYGKIVVPATLGTVFLLGYFIFFFRRTKFIGQALMLNFVGIKKLVQEVELSRSGYVLGTLLDSGLPVVEAISSLADSSTVFVYQRFYQKLKEKVEEGNSFQRSFATIPKSHKFIPAPVQQMIVAAENSGRLPETFSKIGETFEEKLDDTAKNITVLLEPILLVMVWLGVVMVALAVILPIYSLVGGFNQGKNINSRPKDVTSETMEEKVVVEEVVPELPKVEPVRYVEILPTGTSGFLNVRSLPSKQGKIIGRVNVGGLYQLRGEEGAWFKIAYDEGKEGWMSADYGKIKEQ